ncbi:MAG: hypothetical protein ACOY37_09355 [Pseudomonadota bacterium]
MRRFQGDRIRQEWRQNARLRWGVLVVVLILGTRAILGVSDSRAELARRYGRDAQLLARLEATAAERDWPRRAREAEKARSAMLASLPQARNEGAARADLLARLDQLARDAVLAEPMVRVETVLDVPGYPELRQAVGRLEGTVATPLEVAPVARAVAAGLPWLQAEQFEVAEGQPTRVVVIARAYYRRPGLVAADAVSTEGRETPSRGVPASTPRSGPQGAPR